MKRKMIHILSLSLSFDTTAEVATYLFFFLSLGVHYPVQVVY